MNKPYIVCHMMTSIDGRIDCDMTSKIHGVKEYYATLGDLNTPTTVSGRVTAQLELAEDGEFCTQSTEILGKEQFSKKVEARGYSVVVDTRGTLRWSHPKDLNLPLIVITCAKVKKAYLDYLDSENISWVACGNEKIDLPRACEILANEFNVQRMAIVGGGRINAGFLQAGLIDEVSLLIGPGIDGRCSMTSVFDGLPMNKAPTQLKLESMSSYEDGSVHLLYKVINATRRE